MSDRSDNPGALLLSLAIHAGFLASLWLVTMSCTSYDALIERLRLPQFLMMECSRPLSVQGPVIEATLVDFSAKPLPKATPKPTPPPAPTPKPVVDTGPPPDPVPTPELPDAPPLADDRVDQERIDREALEKAQDAEREQEERRKREQQLLEEEQELQARIERERLEQLEDIRRQREQAAERRRIEELKLAQLEEQEAAEQVAEQETQRAGNEGVNDDLLSRYRLAIQQTIERNWLRPDTVPERVTCTVIVTQIPGGEVIAVDFGACAYDDLGRQSVESALRREPLPYEGYRDVFSRKLEIPFCYPAEECPK